MLSGEELPFPWTKDEWTLREEWGWFIGIFEGEGSAIVRYRGGRVSTFTLQLSSTDEDVIQRIQALVGGRVNGPYNYTDKPTAKPYWMWQLGTQADVERLATAMRPFLNGRRKRQVTRVLNKIKEKRAA